MKHSILESPSTASTLQSAKAFARVFDHTDLKPDSGTQDILKLCSEAAEYGFGTVCIAPRWVSTAIGFLAKLQADATRVCTVIGFPLGNTTTPTKVFETNNVIDNGASEIDMVLSIGDLKDGNLSAVADDIAHVVDAAHSKAAMAKVILETGYLTEQEIVVACQMAMSANADFVKTSTGFGPGGAQTKIVRLMRKTVGDELGVKASGGIKTFSDAQAMLEAGATRLGCSASVQIMSEYMRHPQG